jgi:hypothetical protein
MARKVSKRAKVIAIVLLASVVLAVAAFAFRARNAPFAFLKAAGTSRNHSACPAR